MISFEYAHLIARRLRGNLKGFPLAPDAIDAVATVIAEVCRTEHEADWLCSELLHYSGEWEGTKAMREMVLDHFRPVEPGNAYRALTPSLGQICRDCMGLGTKAINHDGKYTWCACLEGRDRQKTMPWYLDFVNSFQNKAAKLKGIKPVYHPSTEAGQAVMDSRAAEAEIAAIKRIQDSRRVESQPLVEEEVIQ